MICCVRDRNAEALRTQSFRPSTSSALSASPRFKTEHGHVLTPGRYVGAEGVEDDGVPFAEKLEGLTRELATQFHESDFNVRNRRKRLGLFTLQKMPSSVAVTS